MKKIIAFVVVAFIATASQAASVNWAFTSSDATYKGAHVYMIAGDTVPTGIENWATWLETQTVVNDKALTWNNMTKKATATVTTQSDAITKDKSYFFVMLDADGKNFKTTSAFKGTDIVYDTAAQESQIKTDLANAFGDWTEIKAATTEPEGPTGDVPEPTSGLLLLVGAAGLALRRRRA